MKIAEINGKVNHLSLRILKELSLVIFTNILYKLAKKTSF
jgi:hypothetical protein